MLEHVRSARPVVLGYLPTRRGGFSRTEVVVAQKEAIARRLDELGVTYVGLDGVLEHGILAEVAQADETVRHFRQHGVDAVLAAHCDFGQELAVGRVCKALGKPVLLWGPRDDAPEPNGARQRDTQCGLFATSKLLRRLGLPFTYVVNCRPGEPVFERGLDTFLRAVNVARCVRGARIGQIGPRPTPFASTMCNEGELLERFDVQLVPVALGEITRRALEGAEGDEAAAEAALMRSRLDTRLVDDEHMRRIAALKLAMRDWAVRERLDALAIQCWPTLMHELEAAACFVNGELADEGVPVACETDIHGAITAIALQAAGLAQTPIFFADVTIRHPEDDNAELLWHCGPFPLSLAAGGAKPWLGGHGGETGLPGVGHFEMRGGPVTLGRFDGDGGDYRFLIGHAEGCDGPFTRGTYLWVRVGNWPRWEEALIYGPYIHHIIGVHGRLAPALLEATKYLGVSPECIEPTEAEIRAYLRGQGEL